MRAAQRFGVQLRPRRAAQSDMKTRTISRAEGGLLQRRVSLPSSCGTRERDVRARASRVIAAQAHHRMRIHACAASNPMPSR